ncbi:MAG: LPS-assembly protein LptD [Micavibrio aeruginosavorus]|uniref:LPS-assembly protein LptD n=1 Tax=Micavibrio aeruginosavorus TaxID=349221 RepID=A0A2W5N3J4_9BACT|nr:MAG: LPS-assembly protein LptD [Micavibrio aeruginosavorus]
MPAHAEAVSDDAAVGVDPWAATVTAGQPLSGGFRGVPDGNNDDPVDLEADNLINDEGAQTVAAIGNVEMVQGGRILKADKVSYNLQTDRVRATGNVVISEADGTTYFAEDVELTDDMKSGFVNGLQILLADGSRFTAQEGERVGGTKIELRRATYTPCEPCKEDPSKSPLWQIRADKVTHDEAEKSIVYHDAWFEFKGVPVAYTPYLSHPDGSEKQKSGFLTPTVGFDSELGASYQQEYYYAIAPDKDLTVGTVVATDVNPVALAEYRQRFENAQIQFNGSATYSDRVDRRDGRTVDIEDETRGHLFGEGLWDMNEDWRSGFNVAVASDDQYLRQYNIDSDDVLENEIYAERFDDRNYFVGRAMAFQDVRISRRQVDQPAVLPEVIASFYGKPNDVLGGRWNAELSALGLYRDGNGQDMGRSTLELGWERRIITGFGLVNKIDANVRGDAYNVQDRTGMNDTNKTTTRGFAQANWETSYPFVKRLQESQVTIAPVVSVTGGTNVDFDDDIPNEDSQDFSLDPTNLFEANRFPGYDLIEDRSHMTYGLRTGWYGDNGYRGEVFVGQSRRFDDDDNPFYEGSGLSDQDSDYVGQITANLAEYLDVDYRFQLENENFSSQRHEFDGRTKIGRLDLGIRYLYASALDETDLRYSREQIRPDVRFRFYDDWYMTGVMWYDLGEDKGMRRAIYGVEYDGQCMTFALTGERTLTTDATGDSDTEIMMRIGFKNLGEFETSGISIGGSGSSSEDD